VVFRAIVTVREHSVFLGAAQSVSLPRISRTAVFGGEVAEVAVRTELTLRLIVKN